MNLGAQRAPAAERVPINSSTYITETRSQVPPTSSCSSSGSASCAGPPLSDQKSWDPTQASLVPLHCSQLGSTEQGVQDERTDQELEEELGQSTSSSHGSGPEPQFGLYLGLGPTPRGVEPDLSSVPAEGTPGKNPVPEGWGSVLGSTSESPGKQ